MVITELWDKMGRTKEEQKELFEKSANGLPVGFVATPEDIAEAYLYCVSDDLTFFVECMANDYFHVLRYELTMQMDRSLP